MRVTKGRVLVRIEDIETKSEGFEKIQTVPERWGVVVDLAEPFSQLGDPGYKVGSRVKIPVAGGTYHKEGEEDYAVFLQAEILLYEEEDVLAQFRNKKGWIDVDRFDDFLNKKKGFDIVYGLKHNFGNGEIKCLYRHRETGEEYNLVGNYFTGEGFDGLIKWLDENNL